MQLFLISWIKGMSNVKEITDEQIEKLEGNGIDCTYDVEEAKE